MDPIVGVRLMTAGDLLYCSPGDLNLMIGDYVVLVTDRGERICLLYTSDAADDS